MTNEKNLGADAAAVATAEPVDTTQLSHAALIERCAETIFEYRFPRVLWTDPLFHAEREDCRLLAAQFREMFATDARWTLQNAAEQLTDASCRLAFGDRKLGSTLRNQVQDFAESYLEDLAKLFPRRLFYPRDVEANLAEVKAEGGVQ